MEFESKSQVVRAVKVSVIIGLLVVAFWAGFTVASPNGSSRNIYLDDLPSAYSYIIHADGSGNFWAIRNDGKVPAGMSGTNDDLVIQYAINNASSTSGSVFVKAASYSASVTLKTNVRLIIEKGATGITVTVDSGATCWLEDYNGAVKYFYSAGSLVWKENLGTGEFWWGAQNRTDVLAYPEQAVSYTVFTDGTNYFMKNGTTGNIDFSSTNASKIINWAIGNLTSGGRVFVKAGSYNVSMNVVVGSNVEVVGEGKGSTLFLGVNQSNQQLFYGLNIENVTLRSLHLSGKNTNNTNEFGVYFINSSNIKIQECSFENFWGTSSYSVYYVGCNFSCVDGCYFEGGQNSAVTLTDCRWSEIIRCKSYNCPVSVLGSAAFVIFGTSSLGSYQCSIVDCVADLSQEHGFQIYQYSYNCSVVGGTVSNCVDTGVCLGNPAAVNTCVGIKCVGVTVSACGSGIILYNKEAVVSGCVVNNCTGNGIYLHDVNVNGSVVSGCFVMRTNNGIAVEGCWNVILGNSIFDVANNAGIYILGDNNTITGNVVRNCNDGIILDTGADFNVVLGCCVFNSSPAIGDYGVGNVKEHNIS